MICNNCGTHNEQDNLFCIKCGTSLTNNEQIETNVNSIVQEEAQVDNTIVQNDSIDNTILQSESISETQTEQVTEQPVYNQTANNYQQTGNNQSNSDNIVLNYVMYFLNVLLKPFKSYKESESKFEDTKTTLIFSSIIAGIMMLVTLIKSMITVIFTKTFDFSTFSTKTKIDFSRLKDLNWVNLILRNLLIYAAILAVVALVYYVLCLIFKKSAKYIKLLSMTATSFIPFIAASMIISPILGIIWTPLAVISLFAGIVYSVLIFVNLINSNLSFDSEDAKIYFHLICLTVLSSAFYYLYIEIMVSNINTLILN